MPKKLYLAVTAVLIVVVVFLGAFRPWPGRSDPIAAIAQPYAFNTNGWIASNTLQKWAGVIGEVFGGHSSDQAQAATVRNYFALCDQIGSLQYQVEGELMKPRAPGASTSSDQAKLAAFQKQQIAMESQVEGIIEGQVARALASAGLGSQAGFEFLFPPVNFRFDQLPSILIVSPRDKIEIKETFLLRSHLTDAQKEAIERKVEALGYSALVDDIGGIATYPTMLPEDSSIRWIIPTVAHEWSHQYFFFQPLGQHYDSSYDMTTINETSADIVGNEIGAQVLKHYYGIDVAAEQKEAAAPRQRDPHAFDFNKEMNSIWVAVTDMLAKGQITQAEQFMEQKRLELVAHGYLIRKLNQAYFAFHGSYADTPGTPNPLGQEVQALRNQSSSLGAFVRAISQVSSPAQLQALVGKN